MLFIDSVENHELKKGVSKPGLDSLLCSWSLRSDGKERCVTLSRTAAWETKAKPALTLQFIFSVPIDQNTSRDDGNIRSSIYYFMFAISERFFVVQ